MKKTLVAVLSMMLVVALAFANVTAMAASSAEEVYVDIPDANLSAALADVCGSTVNPGKVLLSKLEAVENLDLSGLGIKDLTGLEKAKNLKTLDLSDNAITNIAGLTNLSALETLDLTGNKVSGIYSISSLKKLTKLILSDKVTVDVVNYAKANMFQNLYRYYTDYRNSAAMQLLMGDSWLSLIDNVVANVSDLRYMTANTWMGMLGLNFFFTPETSYNWDIISKYMLFNYYGNSNLVTDAELQRWLTLSLMYGDDADGTGLNEVDKMGLFIWLTYNQGVNNVVKPEVSPEEEAAEQEYNKKIMNALFFIAMMQKQDAGNNSGSTTTPNAPSTNVSNTFCPWVYLMAYNGNADMSMWMPYLLAQMVNEKDADGNPIDKTEMYGLLALLSQRDDFQQILPFLYAQYMKDGELDLNYLSVPMLNPYLGYTGTNYIYNWPTGSVLNPLTGYGLPLQDMDPTYATWMMLYLQQQAQAK